MSKPIEITMSARRAKYFVHDHLCGMIPCRLCPENDVTDKECDVALKDDIERRGLILTIKGTEERHEETR
jgi:hypothetical protein